MTYIALGVFILATVVVLYPWSHKKQPAKPKEEQLKALKKIAYVETKNVSVTEHILSLDFQIIETYSFNRGSKLEALLRVNKFEGGHQLFVDANKQFNSTAEKVAVIEKGTREGDQFMAIMTKPMGEIVYLMCTPFYRDALVFRSGNNTIVDVLSICFDCGYIQNANGLYLDVDQKAYEDLTALLMSLGHTILKDETMEFYKLKEFIKIKG